VPGVWAKVDDALAMHPKIFALLEADPLTGYAALGLWVLTLAESSRLGLDGEVPYSMLDRLAPVHGKTLAKRLQTVGMYERKSRASFQIHDFHVYNPSAEEVAELHAARKEAGKLGARVRWAANGGDPWTRN
jgi:hypothetical protein